MQATDLLHGGDSLLTRVRWRIIPAEDEAAWLRALSRAPGADIYDEPAYQRATAQHLGGRALAYFADAGGATLFHPYIVRPIEDVGHKPAPWALYDIETAYGYGGPIASTHDASFLADAWSGYDAWCRGSRVVSEFFRFNPFSARHRAAPPGARVWRDRETVVVPLDGGTDALMRGYSDVQRRNLRKAQRSGLTCHEDMSWRGLADFRRLYADTMHTAAAEDFYHFDAAYFAALADGLGPRCRLFLVRVGDLPVAGALVLFGGETAHYHLAGSSRAHQSLQPNNLLIDGIARAAQARGLKRLHLGGGRSPAGDDELLRLKARFSSERAEIYLGARVLDAEAHRRLTELWREQGGRAPEGYLQAYRLPLAPPA